MWGSVYTVCVQAVYNPYETCSRKLLTSCIPSGILVSVCLAALLYEGICSVLQSAFTLVTDKYFLRLLSVIVCNN